MKALAIIICFIFTSGCLKAKKSPFDLSSPSGFGGFFFLSQNSQQGIGTGTSTGTGTGSTTTSFSVSGSISGFTAGSLILQNNAANDLTLTATNTYSFTGLASGSTYAITIKTNPTGFVCSIANGSGTITANVMNANITCSVITVNPAYTTNGLKWNDYINRDFSKDIFSQADTACNTANTGGYRTCVHAGEIRKFDIPSRSTCTGLTATDNLSALNWICKTNSATGGVSFYSTGLKKGKYLSDLIDWTNNVWQSLTITVKDGTTTHAVSNALKLWTNLIDVSETATPSTMGTIYLYKTNPNAILINTSTNKVSILFKPGTFFRLGSTNQIIQSHALFNWFEGSIVNNVNTTGLLMNSGFSVARNFKVQSIGMAGICAGIELNGNIGNNYLEDIVVANTNGCTDNYGILINSASKYNLLNNISIFNILNGAGISVDSTSLQNTFIGVTVSNNTGTGITLGSNDNIGMNLTTANNSINGIDTLNSQNSIFANIVAVNNTAGTGFSGAGNFRDPTIQNLASFSNQNGLNFTGLGYYKGLGVYKMSNNSISNCNSANGYTGISATGGICSFTSPSDLISVVTISSISNISTFYAVPSNGSSAVTDSKNITTGLYHMSSINVTANGNDWINFENFFRSIGKLGSVNFPHSSQIGSCTTTCNLWDFSLKSTDTVLRNANITGGGTGCPTAATMFTHTWIATSQAACNNVIGATFNGTTCTSTILRNSVELINDGVGNDNGLCEANEDCLLTPNIGSYQGHGNLVSSSTLSGGCPDVTTQGIKLYQYDTNGY